MIHKRIFLKILFCLIVLLMLCLVQVAPAFSIKQFLGIGDDETDVAEKSQAGQQHADSEISILAQVDTDTSSAVNEFKADLRLPNLKKTLSMLDAEQRERILSDEKLFRDFVGEEATNASVLAVAKENKIDRDDKVLALVQRATDNVIRTFYLNKLLASTVPADSPSDDQIQEYYSQNKEKLVVEERVHIWQIFLPITEDMNKEQTKSVEKEAQSISDILGKIDIDFAIVADKYSKHEASRLNGGYMGLIKISDLKPEIKVSIGHLSAGDISAIVKTDEGIHILKKGVTVPKQIIELRHVKSEVVKLMIEQLKTQIIQDILKQAKINYPLNLNDAKIEEWYLKLRTN